ncbi:MULTISPECIES: alpha/beta hydrolase family protein [Tsukamurella]|uniref:alpha/beta hydrolase family protein n=1 Tax=Tsukamurella TaxID=2060 RepID=UPI002DD421CE|nr:alpha/beta hydrolase [Tsukamurella tyrosinosolvens]MEC4614957.1 alpha/beta hydrolase [Tsukamurella tyrosinosolvens]
MFSRGLLGITIGLAAFVVVVTAVVAVVLVRPWEPASEAVEARISESAHVYDPATADVTDDLTGYLYRPATPRDAGSVPVIVLIHGGGWLKSPDASYVAPIARSLAQEGYVVWNVNYRRVGEGGGWPTTFTDLARGVDHITNLRGVAPEMDLQRVTVVGHSAGGQLAAWTAGRHALPDGAPGADPAVRPHAIVTLAGVLDMRLSLTKNDHVKRALGGTPAEVPDRYALVDPLKRLAPAVPLLAVTGTSDAVVPAREAAEYVEKHRARGGSAALVELPALGHGDVVDVHNKWWPTINSLITTVAKHGPRAVVAPHP